MKTTPKRIKRRTIISIISLVLLTFGTGSLQAIAQTNFVGKWELEKQKTDFGKAPEWVLPPWVMVRQMDDGMPLIRHFSVNRHEQPSYVRGFRSADAEKISDTLRAAFSWNGDKSILTIGSWMTHNNGTPGNTITEAWSLSVDKTELIIVSVVSRPDWTKYMLKGFYAKAP